MNEQSYAPQPCSIMKYVAVVLSLVSFLPLALAYCVKASILYECQHEDMRDHLGRQFAVGIDILFRSMTLVLVGLVMNLVAFGLLVVDVRRTGSAWIATSFGLWLWWGIAAWYLACCYFPYGSPNR